MKANVSAYRKLIGVWSRESNTSLKPPLPAECVQALLASHGFVATRDVVELYSLVGGMPINCPDDRMFELWCRERVDEENTGSTWEYLWFGDWLYGAHVYALKPVDQFHSAVYIDHQCDRITAPEVVAGSVYEFASRLLCDPSSVGITL